ncbi:MAG: restriction endonuclease subunit S [Acutalibacteraceae bacterium]
MLKTIGDVCQLLNGYSFKSEKYVDSGIRIIRIANVQKGFIEDNTPAFYPLETPGIENYMLKEGDLLISLTGNVGRVALLNKEMLPAALNQRVACLRIKDDSIYKKFLFHYLNSSKFENTCILESRGVAQKNMSTEWLKRQPIPNYTLQNQIKISKILDSIIEIINKKRQKLVEFDSLIKSRFVEMFGDVTQKNNGYTINDVCRTMIRGPFGSSLKKEFFVPKGVSTYKVYEQKHAINKKVEIGEYYIDEKKFNELKRFEVQPGDVIMSCSGTIGELFVIPDSAERGIINQALLNFRLNYEVINKDYFLYAMDAIIYTIDSKGSGIENITSVSNIKNTNIYLPPLLEQNNFSIFVKQVDKLKFAVQKSLDETQTLFDSLMQKYFG